MEQVKPEVGNQHPEVGDVDSSNVDGGNAKPEVELAELRKQHERVLRESKDWAAKSKHYHKELETLKSKLNQKEKAELEKNENWQERLEVEKREKIELSERVNSITEAARIRAIALDVAMKAPDADYPDLVVDALDMSMIKFNPDTLQVEGVDDALSVARKNYPKLFGKGKVTADNLKKPNGVNTPDKPLSQMNKDEIGLKMKDSLKTLLTNGVNHG